MNKGEIIYAAVYLNTQGNLRRLQTSGFERNYLYYESCIEGNFNSSGFVGVHTSGVMAF